MTGDPTGYATVLYLEVGKRRRIHLVTKVGSLLQSAEGCNLDQTKLNNRTIVDLATVRANRDRLCVRCFPEAKA